MEDTTTNSGSIEINRKRSSRIAGLLYLIVVITGMFSLAYVPKELFVWDNAAQTFNNILERESLFRWSIASSTICYVAFAFLSIRLYQLFKSVNELSAKTMMILALLSVPMSLINLQNKYSILSLLDRSKQQDRLPISEIHDQAMRYLNQYDQGILVATVFWGLWLLPFGHLVYKSGFLPRFFGVLLIFGCLGYLVNYFGNTLFANYSSFGVSKYFGMLPAIGEIGICLWLLIIGATVKANKKQPS